MVTCTFNFKLHRCQIENACGFVLLGFDYNFKIFPVIWLSSEIYIHIVSFFLKKCSYSKTTSIPS